MHRIGSVSILLLAGLFEPAAAGAHGLHASFTESTVTPTRIDVVCLLSVEDIAAHFPAGAGPAGRGATPGLEAALPGVLAFLREHLIVTADDRRVSLDEGFHQPHGGGTFIRFVFSRPLERAPAVVEFSADPTFFERLGPQHTNVVTLTAGGEAKQSILSMNHPRALFSTGYRPALAQSAMLLRAGLNRLLFRYEHLVFLAALVLAGTRLRELWAMVVAFSAACTLALVLAALEAVRLPARLVEGAVALTITCVALDNFAGRIGTYRYVLSFGFGLLHGFGFAQAFEAADNAGTAALWAVISFNVGLAAALLAIAAVLFPPVLWLAAQRYRNRAVAAISAAILLFGVARFARLALGPW